MSVGLLHRPRFTDDRSFSRPLPRHLHDLPGVLAIKVLYAVRHMIIRSNEELADKIGGRADLVIGMRIPNPLYYIPGHSIHLLLLDR